MRAYELLTRVRTFHPKNYHAFVIIHFNYFTWITIEILPFKLFNTFSTPQILISIASQSCYCQTLCLVLRLRVDFVLPLSQEQQEEREQEQEQEEQPLTKIYQKGMY